MADSSEWICISHGVGGEAYPAMCVYTVDYLNPNLKATTFTVDVFNIAPANQKKHPAALTS